MTVEKFCDELAEIDLLENKYDYAEAFCRLHLRNLIFIAKNRKRLEKALKERFPNYDIKVN